nr:flagellar hook-length control protein FliK [uncultured Rhodopila sp.]
MAGEPVLPAAIATVPSNVPVAPTSRATSSRAMGGAAFLQFLHTADSAVAPQGAVVPAAAGPTEAGQTAAGQTEADQAAAGQAAAGQTEAAAEPGTAALAEAPAKPAPETDGTALPAPKGGRAAKQNAAADAAAATAPGLPDVAPLPVAMPQPANADFPADHAALQRSVTAGGETETASVINASGGPVHRNVAPVASPPAAAAEATTPVAPAATAAAAVSRPFRAVARAAEQPAQTASAPVALAITSAAQPAEPNVTTHTLAAPSPPAHTAPTAPTPPAAQIGSALLTLGPAADGSQQMTLRLHPAELGVVQVQIGRSDTGAPHVEITAEKADTMQALLRDQPQLHRALDDAGVPAAGRTIAFHTAPVPSAAAGGNGSGSLTSHQGGTGTTSGDSSRGGGKDGYSGEPGSDTAGRRQSRSFAEKVVAPAAISFRVGIDIVA